MPSCFSKPADPVLQPGCTWDCPGPRQGLRVAQVGPELFRAVFGCVVPLGGKTGVRSRQVVEVRQHPRLGAVGEVAVGQQDDRRSVLDGDPSCFDRRQ